MAPDGTGLRRANAYLDACGEGVDVGGKMSMKIQLRVSIRGRVRPSVRNLRYQKTTPLKVKSRILKLDTEKASDVPRGSC